jgi:hypothetical protein
VFVCQCKKYRWLQDLACEILPARFGLGFSEKVWRFQTASISKILVFATLKKRAAHGDMSRSWGEALRYVKKHSYRGRSILHYHYVACQAFFFIFIKKIHKELIF